MVSVYQRKNGSWDAVGKINNRRRHFAGRTPEIARQRYDLAKESEEYDGQIPVHVDERPAPKKYREVGLDIEVTNLSADFSIVLCACVKPLNGEVITFRLDDYPDRDPWDDSPLIEDLCKLLNQCSRVFTWYGSRMDVPHIRSRKLLNGITDPTVFSHVDLWKVARYKFAMHNNQLDTYAKLLAQLENQKTQLSWSIWRKATFGDKESMDYVVEHCEADVAAMEDVYYHLDHYVDRWTVEVL